MVANETFANEIFSTENLFAIKKGVPLPPF